MSILLHVDSQLERRCANGCRRFRRVLQAPLNEVTVFSGEARVVGIEFLWQVLPFAKLPQPICVNLDPLARSGEDQVIATSKMLEQMG